jgi:hypothetical protein
MKPVTSRHLRLADRLVPKRGKTEDYDPLVVICVWPADNKARVKGESVVSEDWQTNPESRLKDLDGSSVVGLDELKRNYQIDCDDDRLSRFDRLHTAESRSRLVVGGGNRGN